MTMSEENLAIWKQLQVNDYFERHPLYARGWEFADLEMITKFIKLSRDMNAVVIGCGQGREVLKLAQVVRHVWGIDVSLPVLEMTKATLGALWPFFTGVLADNWETFAPQQNIDLVYSVAVFQHLSTEWVWKYTRELGKRLRPAGETGPGGSMIIQFLERNELKGAREPMQSWTLNGISHLAYEAQLQIERIITVNMGKDSLWHWAHFRRNDDK